MDEYHSFPAPSFMRISFVNISVYKSEFNGFSSTAGYNLVARVLSFSKMAENKNTLGTRLMLGTEVQ